jgi:uncharacterized membrane protein (DUF106 family)
MSMVSVVNRLLDRLFELLLRPLRPLPVPVSLSVVSLLTAVAILIVIRLTSNQAALATAKRQMYGDLLEMRLFNDDLPAMWRAQRSMLRHNAGYVRLSLVPALWTLVPLAIVVSQFQVFFGYAGVGVGEPVLVTAVLKSRGDIQDIELDLPQGVRLDTPAIWFPALQQVVWRVVGDSAGEFILGIRVGRMTYEKTLHVSSGLVRRSPIRPAQGLIDQLWYPSEAPLSDAAPVASIRVAYPDRRIDILGWQMSWIGAYIVLSIVFVIALQKPLRVTI